MNSGSSKDFRIVWSSSTMTGALLSVMLLLICVVVGVLLYGARTAELQRASIEASNLSATIAQDIARNIEMYDLSIKGAIDSLGDPEVMAASARVRQMILFDYSSSAPYFGTMLVLDAAGNVTMSSRAAKTQAMNFADREYFRVHRETAGLGLFIGRPFLSRVSREINIPLSRRITKPDGSFGGVIVGTIRLAYFEALFKRVSIASGLLTLLRTDGDMILREPASVSETKVMKPTALFRHFAAAPQGEFQAKSVFDQAERLFHYQQIGSLPLVLVVGLSVDEIYVQWWYKAIGISLVLATCSAIIIALAAKLDRELRRRVKAEANLKRLAEEDGLTGLANRRLFDTALEATWRVAGRQNAPLSLMMIDVDCFKSFNDMHGHPAGDAALRDIGARLADTLRNSEIVARYGGEEFAVILPFTDADKALTTAETVRLAIADLEIRHPGSPTGDLTISVGVATMKPTLAHRPCDLLAMADTALYDAKNQGRNRSSQSRISLRTLAA